MKKIHEAVYGDKVAKVYYDCDYSDHIVKFYVGGLYLHAADYHAYDDKKDAIDTAEYWVKNETFG